MVSYLNTIKKTRSASKKKMFVFKKSLNSRYLDDKSIGCSSRKISLTSSMAQKKKFPCNLVTLFLKKLSTTNRKFSDRLHHRNRTAHALHVRFPRGNNLEKKCNIVTKPRAGELITVKTKPARYQDLGQAHRLTPAAYWVSDTPRL